MTLNGVSYDFIQAEIGLLGAYFDITRDYHNSETRGNASVT